MGKKIVVIGASAASVAFITKTRTFDQESEITCFSGEASLPYNRCFLADFITEEKDFDDLRLKPEEFFKEKKVDLHLDTWIESIDAQEKTVSYGGKQQSYDILFIGTGTHPFYPSIEGIDLPGVFGFHMLSDVENLNGFLHEKDPKNAIVIGAGINGLEAASSLAYKGLDVALIDIEDQVMPQQIDQSVARFIEKKMKKEGVKFYRNQKIVKIHAINGFAAKIELDSGLFLPTHCIVVATGCRVNSKLAETAGLKLDKGSIVINDSMQTSDPSIYAGGDICKAPDVITKELVQSATWSDAMLQGLCAATQLSDKPRSYPGVVGMRDSHFFEYDFYACGETKDIEYFDTITRAKNGFHHSFYLLDGVLQGFVLVSNVENMAKFRTLYLTQQKVEKSDLK